MKKILLFVMIAILTVMLSACGGESSWDRDFNSGLQKFKSGNTSSMTASERKAVNGFLEWAWKN